MLWESTCYHPGFDCLATDLKSLESKAKESLLQDMQIAEIEHYEISLSDKDLFEEKICYETRKDNNTVRFKDRIKMLKTKLKAKATARILKYPNTLNLKQSATTLMQRIQNKAMCL